MSFRQRLLAPVLIMNVLAFLFILSRNGNINSAELLNQKYNIACAAIASDCKAASQSTASTTNVVEYNDPTLHETASIMAMATGYSLRNYQQFVGSLRKTGYMGNIFLVVSPDIDTKEESYLREQNVTMHKPRYINCTHPLSQQMKGKEVDNKHQKELITCVHPYPDIKHRWARFPLLRDLLENCGGQPNPEVKCGGPVLITDMRDTFFQRNPFGPDAPKVYGLQVFQEHMTIRTTHWLVDWPVGECKDVHFDEPMLCSGTTIGTRQAMLDYLEIFYGEMKVWMKSPKCNNFGINGDDQSMHNYMYYSGMLNGVTGGVQAVKNRDGLVNTVGAMGSLIHGTHTVQKNILRNLTGHENPKGGGGDPYDLSYNEAKEKNKNWLGLHYGMTDHDGFFTQFDGSRSFVVHQFDRFGRQFFWWLDDNPQLWLS